MSFNQGEFDFESGSEEGYRNWRQRLDEQKRAFESRWGIILGKRVLVQLIGIDRPLEGIVRVVSTESARTARQLRLRLNRMEFSPAEIESIVRVEDPHGT